MVQLLCSKWAPWHQVTERWRGDDKTVWVCPTPHPNLGWRPRFWREEPGCVAVCVPMEEASRGTPSF